MEDGIKCINKLVRIAKNKERALYLRSFFKFRNSERARNSPSITALKMFIKILLPPR